MEIKPIIVAAGIGAVLLYLLAGQNSTNPNSVILYGACLGAGVQIGVRLLGVS